MYNELAGNLEAGLSLQLGLDQEQNASSSTILSRDKLIKQSQVAENFYKL